MAPSERESMGSPFVFILSVGAIQIFGILAMVLTGIWMGKYLGGFAWDGTAHEFNYHPLCMVIGMVFLYSEGKLKTFSRSKSHYSPLQLPPKRPLKVDENYVIFHSQKCCSEANTFYFNIC